MVCKEDRVSRSGSQSLESVSQPVGCRFSQAASHLARQLANQSVITPTKQTAGQQVLLLIHSSARSSPSVSQQPTQQVSQLTFQSTAQLVSQIRRPYLGECKSREHAPCYRTSIQAEKSKTHRPEPSMVNRTSHQPQTVSYVKVFGKSRRNYRSRGPCKGGRRLTAATGIHIIHHEPWIEVQNNTTNKEQKKERDISNEDSIEDWMFSFRLEQGTMKSSTPQ